MFLASLLLILSINYSRISSLKTLPHFNRLFSSSSQIRLFMSKAINNPIPSAVIDVIEWTEPTTGGKDEVPSYTFKESIDINSLLKDHKKAILFGVPGAFTPSCSMKHLPGFIENAKALKAKGVEAIYCLSG